MAIKRDKYIGLRLRPREFEALKALADGRGETLSELLRARLAPLLGQPQSLVNAGEEVAGGQA